MKRILTSLCLAAVSLSFTSCIDPMLLDDGPGYGGGGYAPRPNYGPSYGPGYSTPPRYPSNSYDYPRYPTQSNHHDNHDNDYYGGPRAWYQAGVGIGKKDRREHHSADYRRHKSQYDGRTEREFARGYYDGYNGR